MSSAYRLLIGTLLTRGRLAFLGLLGVLPVLLGVALRSTNSVDVADRTYRAVVEGYGLGLLVPVVSLVFASAALGDPAEDRTLVYLWLRPVPRWKLTLAGMAAALTVSLPLAVLPLAVAVSVAGAGAALVRGAVVSSALAVVAYCSLFLGLGLRVRRALVWGLAYVLVWEGAVARTARGAARLSVNVHARSVLAELAHHAMPKNASSVVTAVIVPLAFALVAVLLTTRWLSRGDVA
jgi:ABC-2 type transport system permease protein